MAFVAGQKLRAKDLNDALGVLKYQQTDLVRNNSTVVTDIPNLVFDVEASGVYAVEGWIHWKSPTSADIKFFWSLPTGCSGSWGMSGPNASTAPVVGSERINYIDHGVIPWADGFGLNSDTQFATVPIRANVYGVLYVGSTAGQAKFRAAQNTAVAAETRVLAGSWVRLTKLNV